MTARRCGDAPSKAAIVRNLFLCRCCCQLRGELVNSTTSKLIHGRLFKGYLGILIKYIKGSHTEDLILQNHNSKTLRKYPKTSIEVQIEETAWWWVYVYKLFIKVNNYHPLGMTFDPWNSFHQGVQLSRCLSKFSKVNWPISWFNHGFLHK